ncbi:hypothetical protein TELCIR_16091 [Teladorsagia circumcincta]|uniref:Roc domain-containing protein n=1 Tax=Teladorsagia circumcincta TaxID=45464 RepID=A0A2G9TWG6_TELCI|nr:hypothetical protein TELCIR_16091 [Teladorsagia circumcincta]
MEVRSKEQKGEAALGPIAFSAWDFTGQREYHATHHYFLTRRTLYVVVWRVIDGDLALHDVQRWLINIQARAPNSCVVLVGTHIDQISSNPTKFPHGFLEEMENKVRSRFMIVDADKHGLPRVLDLVLVNGKAKSDIKNLLNVIYNSGWEVRIGKERALDQQIPSAYIAMLKVVRELHADLRKDGTSAIMTAEQFRDRTKQRMVSKFGRTFRDDIEFRGVCAFLHDSGEIVHFEDAALRQLIFVDPVWLADYLAAIVALRIIGDENVMRAVECVFATKVRSDTARLQQICNSQLKAEWIVWQTGIEAEVRDLDYTLLNFRTRDEQKRWRTFPLDQYALVEMLFPALSVTIIDKDHKMTISTEGEGSTKLLALVVDLLDTLLEDWYPAIGTRFVHSSEGDLLVNRFVPCSKCASEITTEVQRARDDADLSSRKSSAGVRGSKTTGDISTLYVIHCFTIEECMLAGREYGWLECPSHSGVHMRGVAPDTVFVDIESSLVIRTEQIRRGRLLGRGAFGFVFRATVKLQSGELCEIAQKMLEPVDPGPGARPSALAAYKVSCKIATSISTCEFETQSFCAHEKKNK